MWRADPPPGPPNCVFLKNAQTVPNPKLLHSSCSESYLHRNESRRQSVGGGRSRCTISPERAQHSELPPIPAALSLSSGSFQSFSDRDRPCFLGRLVPSGGFHLKYGYIPRPLGEAPYVCRSKHVANRGPKERTAPCPLNCQHSSNTERSFSKPVVWDPSPSNAPYHTLESFGHVSSTLP